MSRPVTNDLHPQQPEDDWSSGGAFVCERVCVSEKLMAKVGGPAKEATPGNCVTVCGTSRTDACADACQRTVCAAQSHVPSWNDACTRRCTAECVRGAAREQGPAS